MNDNTTNSSENINPIIEAAWNDRSSSIATLAAALSKAQAKIESVKKGAENPFFKSKYADLSSVWSAIREPLTLNGLSILQEPGRDGSGIKVITTLLHSSGEYIRSTLSLPVSKPDAQGFGSAITYARRYALQSIAGIAPEDDDGNAASQNGSSKPKPAINSTVTAADALPKRAANQRKATLPTPTDGPFYYSLTKLEEGRRIDASEYIEKMGATFSHESGCYVSKIKIPQADAMLIDRPLSKEEKAENEKAYTDETFGGDDVGAINI